MAEHKQNKDSRLLRHWTKDDGELYSWEEQLKSNQTGFVYPYILSKDSFELSYAESIEPYPVTISRGTLRKKKRKHPYLTDDIVGEMGDILDDVIFVVPSQNRDDSVILVTNRKAINNDKESLIITLKLNVNSFSNEKMNKITSIHARPLSQIRGFIKSAIENGKENDIYINSSKEEYIKKDPYWYGVQFPKLKGIYNYNTQSSVGSQEEISEIRVKHNFGTYEQLDYSEVGIEVKNYQQTTLLYKVGFPNNPLKVEEKLKEKEELISRCDNFTILLPWGETKHFDLNTVIENDSLQRLGAGIKAIRADKDDLNMLYELCSDSQDLDTIEFWTANILQGNVEVDEEGYLNTEACKSYLTLADVLNESLYKIEDKPFYFNAADFYEDFRELAFQHSNPNPSTCDYESILSILSEHNGVVDIREFATKESEAFYNNETVKRYHFRFNEDEWFDFYEGENAKTISWVYNGVESDLLFERNDKGLYLADQGTPNFCIVNRAPKGLAPE